MSKLNILTTHIDPLPGTPAHRINAITSGEEQAHMLHQSILKFAPSANFHFIHKRSTDMNSSEAAEKGKGLHAELTLNILRLQRDYLTTAPEGSHWIVCDPDFLFFKDPAQVFDLDFDIALTQRTNKKMPYNSGIIFIKNKEKNNALNFYNEKIKIIENNFSDYSNWFGDQLVLNYIIKKSQKEYRTQLLKYNDINIKILNSSEYNYSPRRDHPYLFLKPDVTAFHFKGRCRPYMREFFCIYVSKDGSASSRFLKKYINSIRLELQRGNLKDLFLSARERIIPKDL